MAEYTANYRFQKPTMDMLAVPTQFNENWDKADGILTEQQTQADDSSRRISILETASLLVKTATGEEISVDNSSSVYIRGVNLYGKATVNGEQSPTNPVTITGIGESGKIEIDIKKTAETEDGQSVSVTLENPLYKISDTVFDAIIGDANGTIERYVGVKKLDGTEDWQQDETDTSLFYLEIPDASATEKQTICTHYPYVDETPLTTDKSNTMDSKRLYIRDTDYTTISSFKSFIEAQNSADTPITVLYPLENPVVDTLIPEEKQAVSVLRSYYGNTYVSNSESAYMEFIYIADLGLVINSILEERK